MPAAPVTRGTGSPAATVTLSAQERAMAAKLGIPLAKYGKHKARAEAGGNDPDYSGPRFSRHDPALSGRR